MRLLAHLIFADLRRHRWLIGVWLAALVASAVVDGVGPVFAAQPSAATFNLLAGLLKIVRLLLRILLIALLVQTHPLVGTDAFWLTRPIPRLTLLAAKAIELAVLLVLAPVAAEAALATAFGILPGEIVRVAVESALFAALWVALLSTAAALTPTFARFVLFCGGVLATLALYIAVQITVDSIWPSPPAVSVGTPGPEDHTGAIVITVMLILACVITLIAQYKSRQLWRSGVIAVAAVIGALFISGPWPWPFLEVKVDRPAWAEASLAIVADAAAARPNDPGLTESGGVAQRSVFAPVHISGLQPWWSATIGLLQATLQLDGGRTLTSASLSFPAPLLTDDANVSADEAISGLIGASNTVRGERPPFQPAATLLVIPESEFKQVAPARGHYRGRFHLQLTRHQIEATLPVQPGAEARNGSYHLVVDSARTSSGRAILWLRESDATSSFDRRPEVERTYYLRNRRSREATDGQAVNFDIGVFPRVLGGFSTGVSVGGGRSTGGFWAAGSSMQFPSYGGPDVQAPRLDDAWLRDADLVVVRSTREGGIVRSLDIDGFPLNATSPAETRRTGR